jgi:hypothetical protein
VARDPDIIQREIEQTRDALAATLDQLGARANPQQLAERMRSSLRSTARKPAVLYPLIGVGALISLLVARKLFR